ncbi:diguanylate cyclase domain-containing protein [Acetanaerobacterium elongatum]|uniref:PAS domain S-box-containing protein/diguanylate cyclase (GGDEF) domain-containing protein n=1 Tax=Acetanaerobacterium elongatum TaxID=258515 RepID=A0A1H0EUZ2_9FIRM|nr:diguanylate cyclase [Acetanaerobacterium elongatum]SDN86116.1 PAS domain S-box-containing protein/diguanylate cyclase (GGDEF) domain-containing protein [Acetanaerobacterium elongatum]
MKVSSKIMSTIVLAVIVPLIVLCILINISFSAYTQNHNLAALSDLAHSISNQTEDYFNYKKEAAQSAAINPVYRQALTGPASAAEASSNIQRSDPQAVLNSLSLQLKALDDAREVLLLNAAGRVVISTQSELIGTDYAAKEVIDAVHKNGVYSSPILLDSAEKPYFFTCAPIIEKDEVIGILAIEFDTSFFSDLAKKTIIGTNGYLYFVDSSDRVFAHKYQERQTAAASFENRNGFYNNFLELKKLNPLGQKELKAGEFSYNYNDHVIMQGVYYPLRVIQGYLFVMRPQDEIYQSEKRVALTVNLMLPLLALIAFLAAIFLMITIQRPLKKILASAGTVLKEEGYIRCNYRANNELGLIAESLNNVNTQIINTVNELRDGEKRYRLALEAVSDIVWEYDVETQKYIFMAKDKGMLGSRRVENVDITGCSWAYATDPEAEEQRSKDFARFLSGMARVYHAEYEARDIRGNAVWAESIANAIRNKEDKIVKVIGSITDITQKKLYDIKVLHSAEYDKLTGIYNRATIERHVKDELKTGGNSALMMIDLDNFKIINDTFGHQFGDQILQFVSSSVCKVISSKDMVGRIGGDEFIVFIKEVSSEKALEEVAGKIVATLQGGYEKEGILHKLSGSVGVAQAGAFGANTYKELLSCADFAMYNAKRRGKNKFCLFTEALYKEKVKNDVVAEHLKDLEDSDIIRLSLIPVWCNNNRQIVRFYADIDLLIPEYPELRREEIYKIAVESNRQTVLLEHTFRAVCRAIKSIEPYNTYNTAITYCIPVLMLQNESVLAVLTRVAEEEQVDPKNLELAVDPKMLGTFDRAAYNFVTGIRHLSSEIELLGFGGMYTSYNVISDFHFDVVHFADDMVGKAVHSRKHLSILKSMMDIARQTATACTLTLTTQEFDILEDKLDVCFTYSGGEAISLEEASKIILQKQQLTNKYECSFYKSRLLENTIMGL